MWKVIKWILSLALLSLSVYLFVRSLICSQPEVCDNPTYPVVYCFAGIVAGIWSLILSPRERVYDLIRFVLIGVVAYVAFPISRVAFVIVVLAGVLLIPHADEDFKRGKMKEPLLTVRSDDPGKARFRFHDEWEMKRKSREYIENQGFSHVSATETSADYAEFTARDEYGRKWKFSCTRSGNNVNVNGRCLEKPKPDEDSNRWIEWMEIFSDD